jgi:hypothetical protein
MPKYKIMHGSLKTEAGVVLGMGSVVELPESFATHVDKGHQFKLVESSKHTAPEAKFAPQKDVK